MRFVRQSSRSKNTTCRRDTDFDEDVMIDDLAHGIESGVHTKAQ
jgi:hypothetical protein